MQEKVVDLNRRPLTWEDFLRVCRRENIGVEIRDYRLDEQLRRGAEPRIILKAGLSERYRLFAAWHSLAHWFGHPGSEAFYLGTDGWLEAIELEASTIGLLALAPHRHGAPYPRLLEARSEGEQLELLVEYPSDGPRPRGRDKAPPFRRTTRRQRVRLSRVEQTEFRWEDQG